MAGIGFVTMVTCALNMLFVIAYSWYRSDHPVRPIPRDLRALLKKADLGTYLSISGPSIVMLCADWWAYEGIVIMAASISVAAVGSMAISYNYLFLIYSFPCGFQIGAVSVIGNIIGEENESLGKLMCIIMVAYSSLISCALGAFTYGYALEIS